MTLYHPAIYDDRRAVASYWEESAPPPRADYPPLESEHSADVAIVGAGYTGLCAALHLARDHGVEARVLEAGHVGWGASGRNGGFCCLAATKLSIPQLIARYGEDETRRFYAAQLEGIALVRALETDEGIDYARCGEGTISVAHRASRLRSLEEEAALMERLFGIRSRVFSKEAFAEWGYDSREQFGALHCEAGFALHPLKLSSGLARAAARHGAVIHAHSRVLEWTREGGVHVLRCAGGRVRAKRVIVATNGFTRDELHRAFHGVTLPALSNIIVTRPLSEEELARHRWRIEEPCFNTRTLLYYYRLLEDRRFLFGARGDTTGHPGAAERMRRWMTGRLRAVFPGWRDVPISHFWRGLVCMTRRLAPCVGQLDEDPSVWYGFGYHGNGVNTAPWVGRALARNMAGAERERMAVPAVMRGLSRPFPLPRLRLWGLRCAYLYYRLEDAT